MSDVCLRFELCKKDTAILFDFGKTEQTFENYAKIIVISRKTGIMGMTKYRHDLMHEDPICYDLLH